MSKKVNAKVARKIFVNVFEDAKSILALQLEEELISNGNYQIKIFELLF